MKNIVIALITTNLILLAFGNGTLALYVERIIDGNIRRCVPYYNCKPGHEIRPCSQDYTEEKCEPCPDDKLTEEPDYVQPDYISSVDGSLDELKCFKPLILENGKRAQCTSTDLLYLKVKDNSAHCINLKGCKCNLNKCFYGDPCLCQSNLHKGDGKGECDVGYHLNSSGECVPCPEGFEKNHVGCGPCLRKNITTSNPKTTSAVPTMKTTPKQTVPVPTETTTSDTLVIVGTVVTGTVEPPEESNSTVFIIVGVVIGLVLLAIFLSVYLYRRGKFEGLKTICLGTWAHVHNQDNQTNADEEAAPLNPQQAINNTNNILQRHVEVNDKREDSINRNNSYCPSQSSDRVVFNSGSSISVNRQLSEVSTDGRINSNASECRLNSCTPEISLAMKSEQISHEINRAVSMNERDLYRIRNEVNHPVLRHSESVPQQVSHTDHGETCVSCGSPTTHGTAMRQPISPLLFQSYPENSGGACIPLPDFSNIQSSSPVMNTELPNIAEFKRSLSKDSESSVDLSTSSPFNSIPEETGKELQEEVATESAGSSVTVEPPHISDVDDYNNCHLSHVTDVPQASDITNQIDSRLEQYNHTYTGLDEKQCFDDTASCSVQRLPSEHEEETIKKNDLDSHLHSEMSSKMDSGIVSKMDGDSDLSTKSES